MRVLFTRYACGHNVQEVAYDQRVSSFLYPLSAITYRRLD